jgi:hypothetical protein
MTVKSKATTKRPTKRPYLDSCGDCRVPLDHITCQSCRVTEAALLIDLNKGGT